MARKLRIDFPGALHHLYGRGNHKQDIFLNDSDRSRFLHRLIGLKEECGFTLFAFCLMSNHYHLLIQTGVVTVSRMMHRLLTGYSVRLNDLTESVGHVFQGRYGDSFCSNDAYFLWLIRYIHMNPVEAGMVSDPADWAWSSHSDYLRGSSSIVDVSKGLSMLGGVDEYRRFIAQREEEDTVDLAAIATEAARLSGVEAASIMRRGGHETTLARRRFATLAAERGFSQKEIARFLDCSQGAVSKLLKSNI